MACVVSVLSVSYLVFPKSIIHCLNIVDTDTGTHDSKTSDVENTDVECETTSDRSVDHVNSTDDNSQSD